MTTSPISHLPCVDGSSLPEQELELQMAPRLVKICKVIAYLAITLFGCYLSPIAFSVGALGAVVTLTASPSVAAWIGTHPQWISKYLSSILDEVLEGGAMVTACVCGSAVAVSFGHAGIVASCLATATGYYVPLNNLHHLQRWRSSDT